MRLPRFPIIFLFASLSLLDASEAKHLFILSGQSNMAGLNPQVSFTPAVEQAFGKDSVIVIKFARGGQPIRRWYKDWVPTVGAQPSHKGHGDLYDRLMEKLMPAVQEQELASVTFVWMQGERDAKESHGAVYGNSFLGVLEQLKKDLGRKDIQFVIGRLSDMDMENKRYPHWTLVREEQVKVAEVSDFGSWVDTDDLSMKKDNLHYDATGYKELGQRFADKAIALINADN